MSRIPKHWAHRSLGELADLVVGRTPPRARAEYWAHASGGLPWVSIGDMVAFQDLPATREHISPAAAEMVFRRQPMPAGTLLMSFKLTIGRTAVLSISAYHNEAIVSVLPKRGVDRDYLRFFLPTIPFARYQDRAIKGQTLNSAKLSRLEVALPPLAEQRRIASFLTKLQRRVELEQARARALAALKAATLAKLFREGLRGEPLKDSPLGPIPESWQTVALGEFCELTSGGTPARAEEGYWCGGIPWVKTAEINYRPITSTEETITVQGLDASSAKLLPVGTVLVAMYGQGVTRGRSAVLAISATTNQAVAALKARNGLLPDFLYAWLCSSYGRLRSLSHGANQQNLSLELLRGLVVPLPPRDVQAEIASANDALGTGVATAEDRATAGGGLFTACLERLMTGEIRLPEAAAEAPGA